MNMLHHWAHVGLAIALAAFHKKANIDPAHVPYLFGLQGLSMLLTEFPDLRAKLANVLSAASKVVACLVVVLALGSVGGCANLQPATIQADTSAGLTVALTGYAIAQPEKAKEIQADAKVVSDVIRTVILPSFQQGATSGALLNSSAAQAMTLLNTKIVGLKNGPMIVAEIKLALGLFTSALQGTSSPTAAMSAQLQADLVAFFTGVSQALSAFTGGTQ